MKIRSLAFSLALALGSVVAKPISDAEALNVARRFLNSSSGALGKANHASLAAELQPITTERSTLGPLYYVLGAPSRGFVIVSGDDAAAPILGYSDESGFDPAHVPPSVVKWLDGYKAQLRDVIRRHAAPAPRVAEDWNRLRSGTPGPALAKAAAGAGPLLQSKWNQIAPYNALCPRGDPTGCVATAMAQIMKYWSYPAHGAGFHSYNHAVYGTISANIGNDAYAWSAMPNAVTSANPAVAALMFDAGVSIDMQYSASSSNAYVIASDNPAASAEASLKKYFSYKPSLTGVRRKSYTTAQWTATLKTEINASRPVLYAGFGTGGGHAFVCDGYDANNFFHFNWGWGGEYDGFFSVDNLDPAGVGTGGGSGVYNSGHQAIIGIEPPVATLAPSLALYNYVTPSAATIYYDQAFSVSTNVINNGNGAFNGDLCAAVFDDSSNFIDYVETKTGLTLAPGNVYTSNLVFSNPGLYSVLPQHCTIGVFYRPTGGDWVAAGAAGLYTNFTPFDVKNPSDIEMYSAMSVTPGAVFTRGNPASVTVNLTNTAAGAFLGKYQVNLYNLDGSGVETLGELSEENGLQPGYVYNPPYLTFSSNSIKAEPGTYLLSVVYQAASDSIWYFVGSTNYQNPIKIVVQAAPLSADAYEPNDKISQARDLALNFSGDVAAIVTSGANCHVGTDFDFYRLKLPAGAGYVVAAKLRDAYDDAQNNPYTLDGLVSYSIDSTNWSDAFDDVVGDSIVAAGGRSIFFHVAPHFAGGTGTYALDLKVTRKSGNAVLTPPRPFAFTAFPNPARDFLTVDVTGLDPGAGQVRLLDMLGKSSFSARWFPGKPLLIPVNGLGEGGYTLQVQAGPKTLSRPIRVAR